MDLNALPKKNGRSNGAASTARNDNSLIQQSFNYAAQELRLPGLRIRVMLVTPELAAEWLKRLNDGNRPLRKRYVDRYAASMNDDRWVSTSHGIYLGPDGKIIDGQHRLAAIVASGTSMWMTVAEYETEAEATKAMLAIDRGRSKSLGDLATMVKMTTRSTGDLACSIVQAMAIMEGRGTPLEEHDVYSDLQQEGESIMWAIETLSGKEFSTLQRAPFAYAYSVFPDEVSRFAGLIKEKAGYAPGSAAHWYVNNAVDGRLRTSGGAGERKKCMLRVLRILKAHIVGEGRQKLHDSAIGLDFFKAARDRRGLVLSFQRRSGADTQSK